MPARCEFLAAAFVAALAILSDTAHARMSWAIDPARTHIRFAVDATGWPRTVGEFRRFEGRISVDFERPEASRVSFKVEAASVDVGSSSFSDYLKSIAFLNADKYPTIDFVSTSVEKLSDHTVRVSGDLTLLGVTKPLVVDVDVLRDGAAPSRLDFSAHTHVDRLEFGMNSGFPIISREVDLDIASGAREQ